MLRIGIWQITEWIGGTERSLIEMAKFLKDSGYDVSIYGPCTRLQPFASTLGITPKPLESIVHDWTHLDVLLFYDVPTTRYIQYIMKVPVRINVYGGIYPCKNTVEYSALNSGNDVGQHALVKASTIRDFLEQGGVKYSEIKVSQFPLDLSYWKPSKKRRSSARKKFGFKPDDIVIGTVGRVHSWKNHHRIIDWSKNLTPNPKILLALAGSLPYEQQKQAVFSAFEGTGAQITYNDADSRSFLSAMDIFVSPSLEEGVPRSVMEAMAMKLPVITYLVGGVHELNVKYAIAPNADRTAQDCLRRLVESQSLRAAVGEQNLINIKSFNSFVSDDLGRWFEAFRKKRSRLSVVDYSF